MVMALVVEAVASSYSLLLFDGPPHPPPLHPPTLLADGRSACTVRHELIPSGPCVFFYNGPESAGSPRILHTLREEERFGSAPRSSPPWSMACPAACRLSLRLPCVDCLCKRSRRACMIGASLGKPHKQQSRPKASFTNYSSYRSVCCGCHSPCRSRHTAAPRNTSLPALASCDTIALCGVTCT